MNKHILFIKRVALLIFNTVYNWASSSLKSVIISDKVADNKVEQLRGVLVSIKNNLNLKDY